MSRTAALGARRASASRGSESRTIAAWAADHVAAFGHTIGVDCQGGDAQVYADHRVRPHRLANSALDFSEGARAISANGRPSRGNKPDPSYRSRLEDVAQEAAESYSASARSEP
ncbi:MAG: hypothetical protein ACRDQ7_06015 [Haloechinothrix sp.]